jgi:hypothetical protein
LVARSILPLGDGDEIRLFGPYAILEMGADRILYSTDYPYESMVECEEWFKSVDIALEDQIKIGRLNTMKLFKLENKLSEVSLAA